MKKIVILDGWTLNPGDLSWKKITDQGECIIYERTPPEQVLERAKDADCLLVNKIVLNKEILLQLPKLKYIGVLATGYNVIDLQAARELKIAVTNVPVYGTSSVAQMVFAHILNLTQHAAGHAEAVRQGAWEQSEDFCFWNSPLLELENLTLGIVGYGRIGKKTAQIARSFGMHILVNTNHPHEEQGISFTDIQTLFRKSDFISLHCPLTKTNEKFVDYSLLSCMKKNAFLINTSRGQLINEKDLARALSEGLIAGAGLDVLSQEPPHSDNPLLKLENCFITPHIAWATQAARARLMEVAGDNLHSFLNGSQLNRIV